MALLVQAWNICISFDQIKQLQDQNMCFVINYQIQRGQDLYVTLQKNKNNLNSIFIRPWIYFDKAVESCILDTTAEGPTL